MDLCMDPCYHERFHLGEKGIQHWFMNTKFTYVALNKYSLNRPKRMCLAQEDVTVSIEEKPYMIVIFRFSSSNALKGI